MVLTPCTTGEVLKVKSIVVLPFDKATESAREFRLPSNRSLGRLPGQLDHSG
jgi:hypothetical protein